MLPAYRFEEITQEQGIAAAREALQTAQPIILLSDAYSKRPDFAEKEIPKMVETGQSIVTDSETARETRVHLSELEKFQGFGIALTESVVFLRRGNFF